MNYLRIPITSYDKMDNEFPRKLFESIPLPTKIENNKSFDQLKNYIDLTLRQAI